jgi:broad specificity phosphatase PhoE
LVSLNNKAMTILRVFLMVLIALPFVSCQKPTTGRAGERNDKVNTEPTTVFLVRHSEKESGNDPVLSEAGLARNTALESLLSEVKFDAVFSTPFQRTEMTANAICNAQNLKLINYDPEDLPGFAKKIQEDYRGQQLLVVGHSNTTPTLCGILDGTRAHQAFDESDYSNLMVVVIPAAGPAKMLRLRF